MDNFFARISNSIRRPQLRATCTLVPLSVCGDGEWKMENDPQTSSQVEPERNYQHNAAGFADAKGQPCDGKCDQHNGHCPNGEDCEKGRQLLCCLIFFLGDDFTAHIFACPPRQQVPELQLTTYFLRSIKCDNQMENRWLAYVVSHVA